MTALKAPCPHGRYDRHHLSEGMKVGDLTHCPGGSLLPPDSLLIVPEDLDGRRFWPEWANEVVGSMDLYRSQILDALAAAQPGRET